MRRNRIIWVVLWLLSLVGITFYGGSISYGFFYILIFIPVFSLLYLLYVYICFRIYQYTDGRDFVVNDAVPYSFRLMNEFHLPFAGIRVRFFEPLSTINELSDKIEYELMPKCGITRETTLVCHYRGEYEIGIKDVIVTDYFRLFKITYKNKECKRVTVDPQLVRLEKLGGFQLNAQDSPSRPSKLDVITREYAAGDDARFINWNQSASLGKLMVREQTGEGGNGVSIIMDACRYSKDMYKYLPVENKELELTLAIALFFCKKSIGVAEWHMSRQLVANQVQSNQQFESFYRQMAAVSFDEKYTQSVLFDSLQRNDVIMQSAVVYMILHEWSVDAATMTEKLAERNIYTVIYLICDELNQKPEVSRTDLVEIITVSPEAKLEEVIK